MSSTTTSRTTEGETITTTHDEPLRFVGRSRGHHVGDQWIIGPITAEFRVQRHVSDKRGELTPTCQLLVDRVQVHNQPLHFADERLVTGVGGDIEGRFDLVPAVQSVLDPQATHYPSNMPSITVKHTHPVTGAAMSTTGRPIAETPLELALLVRTSPVVIRTSLITYRSDHAVEQLRAAAADVDTHDAVCGYCGALLYTSESEADVRHAAGECPQREVDEAHVTLPTSEWRELVAFLDVMRFHPRIAADLRVVAERMYDTVIAGTPIDERPSK